MNTNATIQSLRPDSGEAILVTRIPHAHQGLRSTAMSQAVGVGDFRSPGLPRLRRKAVEWPTMALTLGTYGAWMLVTYHAMAWPAWIAFPVGAVLVTLQSSLQHEILHGHPTRSRRVNRILGILPLSLWMPYERYRQTHLLHHVDERLTDPLDDPESYYWTAEDWARLGPVGRALVRAQATLLGRIVLGPPWSIARFLIAEGRRVGADAPGARRIWVEHLLWCVPVVLWLVLVCQLPVWLYFAGMVLPGTGILLIRSFAEHKALPEARERTAIVENSWILGPLFLFNNLHALHHENPMIPWYRYPGWYRENRDRLVAENGGLVYDGYGEVARRFLLWSHDRPPHPTDRAPRRA
jgi:fatty acid desaturase